MTEKEKIESGFIETKLKLDYAYVIGDFRIILDEETKELIITAKRFLKIQPTTSNSIRLKSEK